MSSNLYLHIIAATVAYNTLVVMLSEAVGACNNFPDLNRSTKTLSAVGTETQKM